MSKNEKTTGFVMSNGNLDMPEFEINNTNLAILAAIRSKGYEFEKNYTACLAKASESQNILQEVKKCDSTHQTFLTSHIRALEKYVKLNNEANVS